MAAQDAGVDTASLTGEIAVSGALVAQESGADSFAASGDVAIFGSMSVQETGQDAFAAYETQPSGALYLGSSYITKVYFAQ